jgi:hypothetical protein
VSAGRSALLAASLLIASASATGADAPDGAPEGSTPRQPLLGSTEAELREELGAALRPQKIELRPGQGLAALHPPAQAAGSVDPFAEQQRLVWQPNDGDLGRVEYELFRDRVYRVRWQLAERLERAWMAPLVEHLTAKLGEPYYDQRLEGKFGTGRATLRRAGWQHGPRNLEVRQLNPLVGGPIFLTLSDTATIKAIAASGGTAAPEPDATGPWWQEPMEPPQSLTAPERDALLVAFDAVLARADWPPEPSTDRSADEEEGEEEGEEPGE